MIDGILGDDRTAILSQQPISVGIDVKPQEIATRHVQADTVSSAKKVRRGIHRDLPLRYYTWLQQGGFLPRLPVASAKNAIGEILRKAIG